MKVEERTFPTIQLGGRTVLIDLLPSLMQVTLNPISQVVCPVLISLPKKEMTPSLLNMSNSDRDFYGELSINKLEQAMKEFYPQYFDDEQTS